MHRHHRRRFLVGQGVRT